MPQVKTTQEAKLRDLFEKECHKNINLRPLLYPSGTNGVTISGWAIKPDEVIGTSGDSFYEKHIFVETKPKKEDALVDLHKEEYKKCKHLIALYYNDKKEPVGCFCSWQMGEFVVGPEYSLKKLVEDIYIVYLQSTNPLGLEIIRKIQELWESGTLTKEQVYAVLERCFTDQSVERYSWSFSQIQLFNMCMNLSGDNKLESDVLHAIAFSPESRDERYKLGQFITEGRWPYEIAKLVVELFDKNQDKTIYEPCVGSGKIAEELIDLLFRKYGKRRCKEILENQFKVADIDSAMRAFTKVVLWNKTHDLFGKGIDIKVESSDLEKDDFDLSGMIVYGNYPFNKGTDYNYLSRILRKQYDSGLSLGIFMGNTTTFDDRKVQSKRILGNFLDHIETKHTIKDFKDVAVDISIIEFDKSRVKEVKVDSNFTTLGDNIKGYEFKPVRPRKLAIGESIIRTDYNIQYSLQYTSQTDVDQKQFNNRIPSPDAPSGTRERETYEQWRKDNPEGIYAAVRKLQNVLLLGICTTSTNGVRLHYTIETNCIGNKVVYAITGEILILGLILQSTTFQTKLYKYFPLFQKDQRMLCIDRLKSMPFPKNISERDKHQLEIIGKHLIIEGKEHKKLRDRADTIIERLYGGLKI